MMVSKPRATSVIINAAGQLKLSIEPTLINIPKKNIKHAITIKAIITPPNRSISFILKIYVYI